MNSFKASVLPGPSKGEHIPAASVDPRIKYPSYKSFDGLVDVQRLRSLDGYIRSRIQRRLTLSDDLQFYTGPYTLDRSHAGRPGSRMIYLSRSERPDNYFDLDRTELWSPTPEAEEFCLLTDFIRALPFKATGRILIMYDDHPREVPAHRDHIETEKLHDFIWFRTSLQKPFYMLNNTTGEKKNVESYTAWFDTVNQFHGSPAAEGLAFSIRVDGIFTDELKSSIPKPAYNAASTPSYWASFDEQGVEQWEMGP
jgi:hypothetical protein